MQTGLKKHLMTMHQNEIPTGWNFSIMLYLYYYTILSTYAIIVKKLSKQM